MFQSFLRDLLLPPKIKQNIPFYKFYDKAKELKQKGFLSFPNYI